MSHRQLTIYWPLTVTPIDGEPVADARPYRSGLG